MIHLSRRAKLLMATLLLLVLGTGAAAAVQGMPDPPEPMDVAEPQQLVQASGQVTLLRAHDVGTGYGPPSDFIDVEVVIRLNSRPNQAMGFQLREDGNRPLRQGMLDLLRDAFNHGWTVTIDYELAAGDSNGVIRRVWLTK
jgi:hypothetical protein